jgi:hypothetical protein
VLEAEREARASAPPAVDGDVSRTPREVMEEEVGGRVVVRSDLPVR